MTKIQMIMEQYRSLVVKKNSPSEDEVKNIVPRYDLISHTDLDGYGCNIVAQSYLHPVYSVKNVDYNDVDETIINVIDYAMVDIITTDYKYRHVIFITDLSSSNQDIIDMIDYINGKNWMIKIILIDHHATAKKIYESYSWAHFPNDDEVISATKLFDRYLSESSRLDEFINLRSVTPAYFQLVDIISRYDTWEWRNNTCDEYENENYLNVIFKNFKYKINFVSHMLKRTEAHIGVNSYKELYHGFSDVIDEYKESLKLAIEDFNEYKRVIRFNGHIVAIGMCISPYMSEAINSFLVDNPDIDYAIILNAKHRVISLRSTKNYIDCGAIAKKLSFDGKGGGHKASAGATLSIDDFMNLLEKFYGRLEDDEVI